MDEYVDRLTPAIAYHITFTTYGTWLHGDQRGSIDRKAQSMRERHVQPDPVLEKAMRKRLKFPPVKLEAPARRVIREAIEDYCHFKGWPLLALNVRSNHVHAVVEAVENPSRILNAIKARATRMLRESGVIAKDRPVWTERGNKGRLLTRKALADAIDYVMNRQGSALPD